MPELGDATWAEVSERPRSYLAVPIGSLEQHGPHLPLDTDTIIATALSRALSASRNDVVVTAAIGIGASGEHAGFPGTLSIGTEVLVSVLVELVRSADWANGVILVNGHGGNAEAVTNAVGRLTTEGRRVMAWWPSLPNDRRADSHAGWLETSVLLHLRPDLVRLDLAAAGNTRPIAELLADLRADGLRNVAPNGVLGDPAGASAGDGCQILEQWVSQLVERFDAWAR